MQDSIAQANLKNDSCSRAYETAIQKNLCVQVAQRIKVCSLLSFKSVIEILVSEWYREVVTLHTLLRKWVNYANFWKITTYDYLGITSLGLQRPILLPNR